MIKRIQAGPRMSQAVVHGQTVYLAGQVADDPKADVTTQTRQVLASIDRLLAAAGSDKTRILRANIFLKDIGSFAEMNKVWDAWVAQGHTPARATVQSALATPDYLVEIVVTAALP
ncbi:MAG: RidA family protein [Steroidobacterales bacterium]